MDKKEEEKPLEVKVVNQEKEKEYSIHDTKDSDEYQSTTTDDEIKEMIEDDDYD